MSKLKGALIGYGFISSKGHYPAYVERDDVEIVAICDICIDQLTDISSEIKKYKSYKDLLLADLSLDFVDIATNAASHAEIITACLESGLHVLSEKPLVCSLEELTDVVNCAKKCEKILFPCHNYKHAPVVKAIRKVIESGKIGEITSVGIETFRNTHAVGAMHWNSDWRRDRFLSGGGIAMDHGSHSLYLIFEWLKCYPTSVTANCINLSSSFDTEDNFSATYEFPKGYANIHLSWTSGVRKVIYTLQGTKGAITVDDDRMEVALKKECNLENISHKATWEVENSNISSDWMDSSHVNWFNSMFDKFIKCIKDKSVMNDELQDACNCVVSIMKAYESANNSSTKISIEALNIL
jgi:predicted dehydrogenase